MYGEYEDLASFDGNFSPQAQFRPGLDTLADGDYDLTVVDAALDKAKGDRILRLGLRTQTGMVVERVYWLTTQEAMNRLGADLLALGFPANTWGSGGKTLATELPAAVAKLPGLKFRGTKKARISAKDNKTYHELYVCGRIQGAPMPAAAPVRAPAPAAAPVPADDRIPF